MKYLALAIALLPLHAPATPQDPPAAALVLANARIYPAAGPVIDGGSILIEGGRIKAVGKSIAVPSDAKVLDLSGKAVIPGLVDAGSGLFLAPEWASANGSAEHDVCDALDFFDDAHQKEALASGVTTVCVAPPGRGIALGLAAVVRVSPTRDPEARILKRAAALKLTLGSTAGETSTSIQRYRDYVALRESFEAAGKYREAWDKYRKEFEEYEKKKKAPAGKDEPKKEGAKSGSSKETEPKKPSKPRVDPRHEALLRALDPRNPVTVRIEAHSIDAIELALKLAEEFKLRLVIDQATDAARAADAIAKARVPVAVGPVFRYGLPRVDYLNHSIDTAAVLAKAGVEVSIGSFPSSSAGHRGPGAGRFLMEAAAWASSRGLTREEALRAVTLNPARQLGLEDEIGSISPERTADLVVLNGEPFDAGTVVEKTLAAGEVVWTAPEQVPAASSSPTSAGLTAPDPPKGDIVLLRGGRIVTIAGPEIPEGSVLLAEGKIHSVGAKLEAPQGATIVDLPKGSVVVPGFIDLHSHLSSSFEADETTETVTPHVRAVEAFTSTHRDARGAARSGVTLVSLAPGNANLVGGRPGLLRLNGERLDRMVWKDAHGLKLALGREALRRDAEPTSRSGAVRKLREILGDKTGETWKILVDRQEPALVHARLADDIVRLAEIKLAFGIRAILVHGDEALRSIEAIKVSGMGVAFGPLTVSDTAEMLGTPGRLARAGIPVALISDAPATDEEHLRVTAALAVRHGMPVDSALRALTIAPAALLGIEQDFGTLESGKQGDVVVYSGDPLSLASDIELVLVEGKVVHRKRRP